MEVTNEIRVDLSGMQQYARQVDSINARVFNQWAIRYRTFIQRRFSIFSRGGGDWPPLKYRRGSILRDTSTLFNTMAPRLIAPPGSINRVLDTKDGIEVGFSGNASHPKGATIAQIAYWHHTGAGNLPERKIIVPPDNNIVQAMVQDMQRAHDRATK